MTIFIHIFVLSIHFQAKRLNLDNVCFHFLIFRSSIYFSDFLNFSKKIRAFKSYVIFIDTFNDTPTSGKQLSKW